MASVIGADFKTQVFSGRTWRDGKLVPTEFSIKKGKIGPASKGKRTEAAYILPPFTDPHIHGGWGLSFQDGDFELLETKLKSRGLMLAIPTLQNTGIEVLQSVAASFRTYQQKNPNSIFPFLMVEGPFISQKKKGFQRQEYILAVDEKPIEDFLAIDEIMIITLAPELPGAQILVQKALERGKIPSVGHSQARFADLLKFHRKGIKHFTHYPNAMSGLHHREIGLLGAGLLLDNLHLEVIADGIHNSFDFIRLLLKIRGPTFALASDLIPPAYVDLSEFDGRIIHKRGKAFADASGTLAGGGTDIPEQVQLLAAQGINIEDIVPLACLNTWQSYGLPIPSLIEGSDANFLLLDDKLAIQAVYHQGKKL